MSLRTLWREIKRSLTFWYSMTEKEVPRWVLKISSKTPFTSNSVEIYKGGHFIYKHEHVIERDDEQGQYHEYWYKKRRIN